YLTGFHDFEVAMGGALFPLPVFVVIGHERDRTVLDEIAHTRMKTPTAVAGFLIDRLREAEGRAAGLADWIARYSMECIKGETRRLANIEAMIPALAKARITASQALLEKELSRIPVLVSSRIKNASVNLDRFADLVRSLSAARTARASDRLSEVEKTLRLGIDSVLQRSKMRLESLESLVKVLSPSNTLQRGYSITRLNGKAVSDASLLPPGTRFTTTLLNGTIESEVLPPPP
ncbi:MAG: hypothetical protein K2J48_11295, partial [Muribaculaceae bacterium]|nr:hypothetical protein [Muribaculaceae bacterium]